MDHIGIFLAGIRFVGPDAEILSAPETDSRYESSVKGIRIIGDLSGVPLLR